MGVGTEDYKEKELLFLRLPPMVERIQKEERNKNPPLVGNPQNYNINNIQIKQNLVTP